jgi:16S rRNA (uracil1498-N3)-methyltransferase
MIQFYAKPEHILGDRLELHDQEAHHASKVLRLSEGDEFWATDGRGSRYRVITTSVGKKQVTSEIQEHQQVESTAPAVVLVMSPTKQRARLETAVEKAVELGADEIMLLQSERTERSKIRMDRLETIVETAMKQSLRVWKPTLTEVDSLEALLKHEKESLLWLAHEAVSEDQPAGFSEEQHRQFQIAERVLVFVGPEGGYSETEVQLARDHGAEIISLGSHRLRAETAAIAILSLLIPLK